MNVLLDDFEDDFVLLENSQTVLEMTPNPLRHDGINMAGGLRGVWEVLGRSFHESELSVKGVQRQNLLSWCR